MEILRIRWRDWREGYGNGPICQVTGRSPGLNSVTVCARSMSWITPMSILYIVAPDQMVQHAADTALIEDLSKKWLHKLISLGAQLFKVISLDNRFLFLCNQGLTQRKRVFSRHNWQPEANSQALPRMGFPTLLWFETRQCTHDRVVPGRVFRPKHWSLQCEGPPGLRRCQQGLPDDLEVSSLSWWSGRWQGIYFSGCS